MVAATMNNDAGPQLFLKELKAMHENPKWDRSTSMNEQTPEKRDVKLLVGQFQSSTASLPLNEMVNEAFSWKREESAEMSVRSYDSYDMSEGDSSMSSLVSINKLYGRETEEALLQEAFDRITKAKAPRSLEYVLISGASGTGKTRLGESLRQRVRSRGGFFASAKFDQQQADPFAALCGFFSDYARQILAQGDDVVREVRQRIRSAVEGDLCALVKMIPPLGDLMMADTKPDAEMCPTRCDEKQGRSIFAMHKLMRAISSPEIPVVMMLDDLQWASKCPLEKLRAMVVDDMNAGIMFVGISRDDVAPNSELSGFLRKLEDDRVHITNVALRNLELANMEEMVNDLFLMPLEQSESLAKFVFDHSAGNVYFVAETLRMLQADTKFLKYDKEAKTWTVDDTLCDRMLTFCPSTFIKRRLRARPRDMQKVLMVASCLGSNITEHLVETALQEPVKDRFEQVVKMGRFTYNERSKTYSFRHSVFQTACYDLISEEIRPGFHLEIGLRLWKHLSEEELDENLFAVLNQLKRGSTLMRDQAMRYEVAALCVAAAKKAASVFSFPTASEQLQFACILLGPNHWEEAYDLSLVLYNYAAEVEFSLADSDHVDYLLQEVLDHARDFTDKIRAYSTQVYTLSVRNKIDQAIAKGICVLKQMGVTLSPQCLKFNLAWAMTRIDRKLRGKSDQSIKRLPHMTDSNKLAAMQILNLLFLNTYLTRRDLFPFVVLKMMKLTVVDGLSAISSVAFAGYGSLLCFAGQCEEGLRYGKLALELVEEFDAQSFQSRVGAFVWGSIFVHVRPWADSLEQLKEGHRLGLQTGDTEFAMLNAHLYTIFMIENGNFPMSEMLARGEELKELTELHGHSQQFGILDPFMAGLKTFNDPDGDLLDHSGALERGWQCGKEDGNSFAMGLILFTKSFFYFIMGDYDAALEMIDERLNYLPRIDGSIHESFCIYIDGLTSLGASRQAKNSQQRRKLLKRGRSSLRMMKVLAKQNPASCLGKSLLLEAECYAVSKKCTLAREKYDHAIALSATYGSYFELAFSNQVAGEHCINDLNDIEGGIKYYRAACKAYDDWEGFAATTHLKKKIFELEKLVFD